jgi:hypothetical protein
MMLTNRLHFIRRGIAWSHAQRQPPQIHVCGHVGQSDSRDQAAVLNLLP